MDLNWFRQVGRSPALRTRAFKLLICLLVVNNMLAAVVVLRDRQHQDRADSVTTTPDPHGDTSSGRPGVGAGRPGGILGGDPGVPGGALVPAPGPEAPGTGPGEPAGPSVGPPGKGDGGGEETPPTEPIPAPPPLPPPTYLSSHFADYMKMGGDQVVVVPDGTYDGGLVTAPHPATNGPYGGWLVLVAEHPGQTVIDLTNSVDPENNNDRVLYLKPGTSHIAFIGISFRNGVIRNEADSIRFWYCDHQDQDYNYMKAHRGTPRMLQSYNGGNNLEVYGDDLHNGVATAVLFGSLVTNVTMQGVRIFDIDPRFGSDQPGGDPESHIVPMGSPEGSHSNFNVLDSYLEGYYTLWGTNTSSLSNMTWKNIWYGFGYPSPFLLQAVPGHKIQKATRANWQIFGPNAGYSQNGNDPYIYIDDKHYSGADAYQHRDRIDLTDSNIAYGYPAGVSDQHSAQSSPSNPANVWRAANPYDSWQSFFGWT